MRRVRAAVVSDERNPIFFTLALSLLAGVLATVLFVLPAEYGIDPLGAGETLGIKGMSGVSVSALSRSTGNSSRDVVEFPLMPFESVEYKYELNAGQGMLFSWSAEDEVLFDLHSEEENTDPEDAVSFSVGRASRESGTYVAPYTGIHGWFWENRGDREVTVKLETFGFYTASITYSSAGAFRRVID
jgi:hypothetical protein